MKPYKKPLIIFIYGPPGSGKGTQADLLVKKFGLEYFDSGTALRQRQKIRDFTGKKLIEVMNRGEWVPESVICKLWMDELEKFKQKISSTLPKAQLFISEFSPIVGYGTGKGTLGIGFFAK